MAAASNVMGERIDVLNVKVMNNQMVTFMIYNRKHTFQEVNLKESWSESSFKVCNQVLFREHESLFWTSTRELKIQA